jgi:hypothetical protein
MCYLHVLLCTMILALQNIYLYIIKIIWDMDLDKVLFCYKNIKKQSDRL